MISFQLQTGENIIKENADALWMKSSLFAKPGRLLLTNRRLVFEEAPSALYSQGLAGLVAELLLKHFFPALNGGIRFDIPLSAIVLVSKDSFGLNEMVSLVYSGQEKVRFGIGRGHYVEWETALSLARGVTKKAA